MNAVIESRPGTMVVSERFSAAEIRAQVNLVQEVMKAVMQEDVHYGKIPGTPKPTLYKAGGEKLAQTFRLAPTYSVEDFSDRDVARYRVTCRLTHQTSGIVVGDGIGSCSSAEEKYKWRRPVCDEEFDDAPDDRRRFKWVRGQNRPFKAKQVRTEKADIENTVLKMAAKRAFLAAILNATAASDIFTQDIEDLPEELRHDEDDRQPEPVQQPQSKRAQESPAQPPPASSSPLGAAANPPGQSQQPAGAAPASPQSSASAGGGPSDDKPLSDGARKALEAQLKRASRTEADLIACGYGTIDAMKFSAFNDVMKYLKENPAA